MKTKKQILLSLALPALLHCPNPCTGTSYSVKGSFSYQVFAQQKEGELVKEKPLLREFEVLSDGCAWKIRIVLVGNTDFDSFIYSYDRTNLLHYSVPAAGSTAGDGVRSVTVEASPVPATITSAAGEYVWLALASGCYLKDRTNNRALSFERLKSRGNVVRRHNVSCRFELSTFPPYLPNKVEYVSTNRAVFLGDDGNTSTVPLPSAFENKGYTSAEFKSGGFTNVDGFGFPATFEYRKYQPKPNAKTTNDVDCVVIVRGKVTSFSTTEQGVDCALPSRQFMIYDLRAPEPNVVYRIADGVIPAADSPIAEKAGARAKRRFERSAQPRF